MVIENAFGLLKNKFARIHTMLNVKSALKAICIIEGCIRLHNFIIDNEAVMEQFEPMEKRLLSCNGTQRRYQIKDILTQ